ncbi:hypothetical protein I541_5215 [Mycobacteroides abscessus]|nr:hypothetical protein I541_5215 [Mycobacteroides abscessus]
MNDTMKANGAEMARLASRVAGRAKDAFPEVDFEAAANAVAGTEFAEVLRAVSAALKRAGAGRPRASRASRTLFRTARVR